MGTREHSRLWLLLQRRMAGTRRPWQATRVENLLDPLPDVAYSVPVGRGWIELKTVQRLPSKETTPVRLTSFSARQLEAFKELAAVHPFSVWMLVWLLRSNEFLLFDSTALPTLWRGAPASVLRGLARWQVCELTETPGAVAQAWALAYDILSDI